MRVLFILSILFVFLFGSDCADEYDYRNFPTAPEEFKDVTISALKKFMDKPVKNFKEFTKTDIQGSTYYLKKDSYIKLKDYYYPAKNGVWKLHANRQGLVDEIDIAIIKLYKDPAEDLANELNDDMGNLWVKWDGDAYGYKMVPEYTQLNLDNYYLSVDAFIFGSEDDATGLEKSVIDLHLINYTHEVEDFIKCQNGG